MAEPEQLASALRLLAGDTAGSSCPSRPVVNEVTSRWATLILAALITGPHRFAALRTRVGPITEKVLSQKLKALVRAGLVARDVHPTVPPQVTYRLTELGESLAAPLTELLRWFGGHSAELVAAQHEHDTRNG